MQIVRRTQPFDGRDFGILMHDCQRQAGVEPAAIHQHGTGAALPVIAAFFRAGKLQVFPQRIQQGGTGIHLELLTFAVDAQRQGHHLGRGSDSRLALSQCATRINSSGCRRRCADFYQIPS